MSQIKKYDWSNEVILIAEDDTFNFLLLKKVLGQTGAKVLHARDGTEALELLNKNHEISLAILDLIMPKMNGIDIVVKCRTFSPNVIFIAYTADVIRFNQEKCLNAGFACFIAKPILPVKFLGLLDNVLSMRSHLTDR